MVDYYEEVYGEGSVGNPWFMRIFPILSTALVWPYSLILEKHRFFYCKSNEENREFFVSIWSELRDRKENLQEK